MPKGSLEYLQAQVKKECHQLLDSLLNASSLTAANGDGDRELNAEAVSHLGQFAHRIVHLAYRLGVRTVQTAPPSAN